MPFVVTSCAFKIYTQIRTAFNVDISTEEETVHPSHFCNTCNTKMHQYNQHSGIRSEMLTTVWEPHSERGCALASSFSKEVVHGNFPERRHMCYSALVDLEYNYCIPDRPVQSSCGKLVCFKCNHAHKCLKVTEMYT